MLTLEDHTVELKEKARPYTDSILENFIPKLLIFLGDRLQFVHEKTFFQGLKLKGKDEKSGN